MIGLHAAGISDVGQQRAGNEDSLHVGDSVFAVADGMGGHQAGEIASELALRPIAALDGRVFGDVDQARTALGDAVVEANRSVVDAAAHDRSLSGMGTTLTAALFEGRRLHVAHVGDSRAYLLRAGEVVQLTRDHTFVQQLLDDGRITPAEVATHPHRSVITRAIGARDEVEVDLQTIDLRHDDAVLLCSDGLSGVVDDAEIGALLRSRRPPVEVVTALVDAANDAGGPDNITAVLLTVVNTRDQVAPYDPGAAVTGAPEDEPTTGHDVLLGGTTDEHPTQPQEPQQPPTPVPGGDTGPGPGAIEGDGDRDGTGPDDAADAGSTARGAGADAAGGDDPGADDPGGGDVGGPGATTGRASSVAPLGDAASGPEDASAPPGRDGEALVIRPDGDAGSMRPLPGPGPDESLVVDPAVRRRRVGSVVVAVAIVLGLFVGGGRWLLSRSFFVGLSGGEVVIYKGIPAGLGPIELSWVYEETGLSADQLPEEQVAQLEDGIAAANGTDARSIVGRYRQAAAAEAGREDDTDADDTPGDSTGTGGDAATSTGASPSPTATP